MGGRKNKLNLELLKRLVDSALFKAKFYNKDKVYLKDIIDEIAPMYYRKASFCSPYMQKRTPRPSKINDTKKKIRLVVSNLIVSHGWKRKSERIKDWEYFDGVPYRRDKKHVYFIRGKDDGINQHE